MTCKRGNVDNVLGLLRLDMWQDGGDAIKDSLDVDIDHPVTFVHF